MSFNKHATLDSLNESKYDWTIRVRAQAIWEGISRESKEFCGLNIIFIDDCNRRIHAFIGPTLCPRYKSDLEEGVIYIVSNFSVKYYNGDEPNRAIRNGKHIYFTSETILTKDSENRLTIQPQSFDLFCLDDVDKLKKDNRFLIDVVGVIEDVPRKFIYKKEEADKLIVKFSITDGSCYMNVTFFNELGVNLLNAIEHEKDEPVIITIASAKISEWNDEVGLSNFPATRFYLNNSHHSVRKIRKRLHDSSFYMTLFDDEEEKEVPTFNVKELLNLNDDYIEKKVQCKLIVKKVDQNMKWYSNYCIPCDVDLEVVDKRFKCPSCGKMKPYPDKRYELSTLCSDDTGTIPILWKEEELIRITGKTVYDVLGDESQVADGDQFPPLLKSFEKKCYNFTMVVSEENVKQGSNVFTAEKISECPEELSATHSPSRNISTEMKQTVISNDTNLSSPPTAKSSNKTKAKKTTHPLQCELKSNSPRMKCKKIKVEKA